jgi:hypothetical protein
MKSLASIPFDEVFFCKQIKFSIIYRLKAIE